MERNAKPGTGDIDDAGKQNQIVLNCGTQGCCPTIRRLLTGEFELVGDDGQKVSLSDGQAAHLQRAIGELRGS